MGVRRSDYRFASLIANGRRFIAPIEGRVRSAAVGEALRIEGRDYGRCPAVGRLSNRLRQPFQLRSCRIEIVDVTQFAEDEELEPEC